MSISYLAFNFSHIEYEYTVTEEGVDIKVTEEDDVDSTFTLENYEITELGKPLLATLCVAQPDEIEIRFGKSPMSYITTSTNRKILEEKYLEVIKRTETATPDDITDWNLDSDCVYIQFMDHIQRMIDQLSRAFAMKRKEKLIKDKTCPVTHEPLTMTCLKFKKCEHYISRDAYERLNCENGMKACPLCRAKHERHEVTG